MHGLAADGIPRASALAAFMRDATSVPVEVVICPPATLLRRVAKAIAGSGVQLGGQDCHGKDKGPHTGDISAAMLADAGCSYVILGHSERRIHHGEDDQVVRSKTAAAHARGLKTILCVGELEQDREMGRTLSVVGAQLEGSLPPGTTAANTVIAYEPIWAIGSGCTPTATEIEEVHGHIRSRLGELVRDASSVRILYGGSVTPDNSSTLLQIADVDGALVGGASLDVDDFWAIVRSCP